MIRKSNFVKTSSFKISDDRTPITSLVRQSNSTNESLHVIGQQPDHSENTAFIKNSVSEKSVLIEKPLFDNKEKVLLRTSPSNMLEVVDKMLSDLKIKMKVLLEVHLALFQRMKKKLFLMNILILTLFLLFLLKRF